jgi:hypothetical protein
MIRLHHRYDLLFWKETLQYFMTCQKSFNP